LEVRWTERAVREADRLDRQTRARIVEALDRWATAETGQVVRLRGHRPPQWRLRVGKWRIRFTVDASTDTLYVLHVLPRDKAYRT